ncbi:MAG: UDP-N-acetylmuramate:L-alanyl-gamma-D-glutamyl-meso-diaminopimelate ligase [Deltaproteobacteria bacterium]|nr:UDP-N-acetylmuramate:L-alanyl-gamma-D-glutamyl-meso-diaminopimelate ligase [Deltaproteobacteria bacterium]
MSIRNGASIYFLGIGGTGMATVAGLCAEAGYKVFGSDAGVYPPMSTMLAELNIPVKTPLGPDNVRDLDADLVVIANVMSRGNPELEAVLAMGVATTSFPQLLGDLFLRHRTTCVVAGTHGKTTTSSLLSHVLHELGEDPSFVIGGIPRNFPRSFRLGTSPLFVIEGDEYDTAYFDKGPKFLHYHPTHLILNNLEYDHADIYPNLEAITSQFVKLSKLVKDPKCIIANVDDTGVSQVISQAALTDKVTKVSTLGLDRTADVRVASHHAVPDGVGGQLWTATIETSALGNFQIQTQLSGKHNLANIAQVIGCLVSLQRRGDLKTPVNGSRIAAAIRSFLNVQRRLDLLASAAGIDVYEDFAHHPTAVRLVIEGFKAVYPQKRLMIAFEPRSASQRRNVFQKAFAEALSLADRVYIGECIQDQRIPPEQRMNTSQLQQSIGTKAVCFPTNLELEKSLLADLTPGDAVIFMSSGSFSGVQHRLAAHLHQNQKNGSLHF